MKYIHIVFVLAITALLSSCVGMTDAPTNDVVSETHAEIEACDLQTIIESEESEVKITCNLSLPDGFVLKKNIELSRGQEALVIDLNGGRIEGNIDIESKGGAIEFNGGKVTGNIYIQADDVLVDCNNEHINTDNDNDLNIDGNVFISSDEPDDTSKNWPRPNDITVRNCFVKGYLRMQGLGKNGEAEEVRLSSHHANHTAHAQASAPKDITLDNITIKGTGSIPLYIGPGVTHVTMTNSTITGRSDATAIYLDAESGHHLFKHNNITTDTKNRELVAVDGSAFNLFVDNFFSRLSNGGIFLYRNAGLAGTVRHQPPSYNQFIDNYFVYDTYTGGKAAIHLGEREGDVNYGDEDNGYPYGSSVNNWDLAHDNVMARNRIRKREHTDMLKSSEHTTNTFRVDNRTVDEDYKNSTSPCYVPNAVPSPLIEDGESVSVLNIDGQPRCLKKPARCVDGLLEINEKRVEPYDLPSAIGGWDIGRVDGGRAILYKKDFDWVYRTFLQAYPRDFNAFIFGNVESVPHLDGALAAKGNITLKHFSVNGTVKEMTAVVAGGKLKVESGTLHGNVYVGDDSPLPANVDLKGMMRYGHPIDFNRAEIALTNLATELAGASYTKSEQGETTIQHNNIIFEGDNSTLNVFRVKATDVSKAKSITLSIPFGANALITITHGFGDDDLFVSFSKMGIDLGQTSPSQVLWNMHRTKSVTLKSIGFLGSLLAPKAEVDFDYGYLKGTLVAASLKGTGELQHAKLEPWRDFVYSDDDACSYPRSIWPEKGVFDFECSMEGDNQGCIKAIACPSGLRLATIKAACHLECSDKLSRGELVTVAPQTIEVKVDSEEKSKGVCQVGDQILSTGTAPIDTALNGVTTFDIRCKEHDENGGDCTILGQYECTPITLPW